jgi:catechol 2,3-dioxygenase-like lactoylglutathione lyase family enzyme
MSRVKLIHHVNIQISDRQRTREWYERALGAEFLDRGPALNRRQLQLRIGSGELHFTETPDPIRVPRVHFAVEVDDWEGMLAHLDALGIPYSRTADGQFLGVGGEDPRQGRREDNGEHYTYIRDPDGNLIELVHHPLGLEDSKGNAVEVVHDPQGLRWRQLPGFVAAAYASESSTS